MVDFAESKAIVNILVQRYQSLLPGLPSLGHHAMHLIESAGKVMRLDILELELLLREHPTLIAYLLRIANSPFYRREIEAITLHDAVNRVGRQELANCILAAASKQAFTNTPLLVRRYPELWSRLQTHFLFCAFGAAYLGTRLFNVGYDISFVGGMFHDVGKMIALATLSDAMEHQIIENNLNEDNVVIVLEEAHSQLGYGALQAWTFPKIYQDIALKHHQSFTTNDTVEQVMLVSCLASSYNMTLNEPSLRETKQEELKKIFAVLAQSAEEQERLTTRLAAMREHVDQIALW